MSSTVPGPDGLPRCSWCAGAPPGYIAYHDHEWGFPVADDLRLFEKVSLEGFQSGLSWRTILDKRENFRTAFKGFDFREVANFGEKDVARLLADAGIVRHRGKIEAVIHNAKRACELVEETGTLAAYFWRFEPAADEVDAHRSVSISRASRDLSKDLKRRAWKFVGPTTMHALIQAMGLVNDHADGCVARERVEQARKSFRRPSLNSP
ncbi:DNA-3-methyladenine glycosylase I [Ramlibacter algicola]|uniref:DNA-3-methyladenine glycosylase I n=1 Tax=Ramlibacter algicola TaxID=2795217 RepID=A0A934PY93_9BURK|nr:DNA-3-methyladenine glycosylase I [Ramlibacter algicola]MBK0392689.1 DNA-3-methyladenine glycosylase I [Ramlibacter algicola]